MRLLRVLIILVLVLPWLPTAEAHAQTSTPIPTQPPMDPANTMEACWDFEWDYVPAGYQPDMTGNGHLARPNNAGGSVTQVTGQSGYGSQIAGAYNYVIDYTTGLIITDTITIAAWIKLDSLTPGVYYTVYSKMSAGQYSHWLIVYWDGDSSSHKFSWFTSPDGSADNATMNLFSTEVPQTDVWFFIAGQFDTETGDKSIYVNGVMTTDENPPGGSITPLGSLYTIGSFGTNQHFIQGTIDTLRIYNYAISLEQLDYFYNNPSYGCNDFYFPAPPFNVLGDSDFESWPGSDYWRMIDDFSPDWIWFGRKLDALDFLWHGTAYCGNGFQHIEKAPEGIDAPIYQNFSWDGGTAYFAWYVRTNFALYPRPPGAYTAYIRDLLGGTIYVIDQDTTMPTTWTKVAGSVFLVAGYYRVEFYAGSNAEDDVYIDRATIWGGGPVDDGCLDETFISTPTPGTATITITAPVMTDTPTTTASPTPTGTPAPISVPNCDFEAGKTGWTFSSSTGVAEPGGPVRPMYGYSSNVYPYISYTFYKPGGNLYLTAWAKGDVDIRAINTGTNSTFYLAFGPEENWSFNYVAYSMPAGNYRFEMRRGLGPYGYAYYDGITLGVNGWDTASKCYQSATPTPTEPATTFTPRPTTTPLPTATGATLTPSGTPIPNPTLTAYPSATRFSTGTAQSTYTPIASGTPFTVTQVISGTVVYNTTTPIAGTPLPGSLPTNWPVPPGPGPITWNIDCQRPQNVFDLAAWLDYENCELKKYISWGPPHSATMAAIPTAFANKEPWGTVNEIRNGISGVQDLVGSYDWSSPGIPGVNDVPAIDAYTGSKRPDSPWNTGQITLSGSSAYSTLCTFQLSTVVGSRLSTPMCFMFNTMRNLSVLPWLQTFVNLFSLVALVTYIVKKWIDAGVSAP